MAIPFQTERKLQFYKWTIGLFFMLIVESGQSSVSSISYEICGTPSLHEQVLESGLLGGKIQQAPRLELGSVPPTHQIGEPRKFYAFDQQKNSDYLVQAVCRAVGEKSYIFVETGPKVLDEAVLRLQNAFEGKVVAGKPQIYESITRHFGSPPDELDLDPRIYILILDIHVNPNQEGAVLAGYFDPVNQFKDAETSRKLGRHSNEVEMVYLNSNLLRVNSDRAEETLAHEFTHLIQWARDPNEATWVDEGTAVYTEAFLGYDVKSRIAAYEESPDTPLRTWLGLLANYGTSYLFFAYLSERYGGMEAIAAILRNLSPEVEGIQQALSLLGQPADFAAIFSDWVIANYLDNPNLGDGRYGYTSLDVHPVLSRLETKYPVNAKQNSVNPWAANYLKFTDGDGKALTATLETNQKGVAARTIKVGITVEVSDIPLDASQREQFSIPQFGKVTKEVVLVVIFQPSNFFRRQGVYTYSAALQSQAESLAVSPASKRFITWGHIKKEYLK